MSTAFEPVYLSDHRAGPAIHEAQSHLDLEKLPIPVQGHADSFERKFLKATPPISPTSTINGKNPLGISPKMFVQLPGDLDETGRSTPTSKVMIKPFYEDFGDWGGKSFYPISGFSELATQALYHAGDIGHLTQKVHAFEQMIGDPSRGTRPHPLLAIHLDPHAKEMHYIPKEKVWTDDALDDAAKMGLMDYLTNHQDRHGSNIMAYDNDTHKIGILGIDNGRSFQYRQGQRHTNESHESDNPFNYLLSYGSPAMRFFQGPDGQSLLTHPSRLRRALSWWDRSRLAIIKEMDKQARTLKDDDMRAWIVDNFKERVRVLDKMSELWKSNSNVADYLNKDQHWHQFDEGVEQDGPLHAAIRTKIHPNKHGIRFLGFDDEESDEI